MVLFVTQAADARGNGSAPHSVVHAFQSVTFEVPFRSGRPAVVTLSGNGATSLDLIVYDADDHMTVGVGVRDQKVVELPEHGTGTFYIEVPTFGSVDNTFVISTN